MFTINQSITDLKIREKDMLKMFFSMNNHQVATPEMMLEDARSYIMFFREPKGKISSYIGLHLLLTDRRLFYAHSSNPFPEQEMDAVEEEALGFAEGLGALLDELDLTKMSPDEKNGWIDTQEIFNPKPEPAPSSEVQPGDEVTQDVHAQSQEQQAAPAQRTTSPVVSQAQEAPHAQPVPPIESPQTQNRAALPKIAPIIPQPQQGPASSSAQQQPIQPAAHVPQAPPARDDQSTLDRQHARVPRDHELRIDKTLPQSPELERNSEDQQTTHPQEKKPPDIILAGKREKTGYRTAGSNTALVDSPKGTKKAMIDRGALTGIPALPKRSLEKEAKTSSGVVSRDREALARLLASF